MGSVAPPLERRLSVSHRSADLDRHQEGQGSEATQPNEVLNLKCFLPSVNAWKRSCHTHHGDEDVGVIFRDLIFKSLGPGGAYSTKPPSSGAIMVAGIVSTGFFAVRSRMNFSQANRQGAP